ncbi:facilitated trehalose transporter Tret1-like [Copidosoma floridanum]|uniref:facilitated trehalose transporter Tret1-like n=1 Tax=Copidosoma floridanum TaxID=29053 RepID=UPI0006C9CA3B|nr:facilitated trehalose transporter Tret1-like [Copidosoma floridanum]
MENLMLLIDNVNTIPGVENCSKSKSYFRQWVVSASFSLVIMLIGMSHGHTAILLQQINPISPQQTNLSTTMTSKGIRIENGEIFNRPELVIESKDMQSWIASVLVLFNSPSCWILAAIGKSIGRKPVLIASTTMFTVAWFVIVFADNACDLMVSRSAMSLSTGILAGLTSIYQGECSSPKVRPIFNAMQGISFSLGILSCHAVGVWYHWRTTALFCGLVAVIALGMCCILPESPVWLLHRGRFVDAIHSWTFLRGNREFDELESMYVDVQEEWTSQEKIDGKKPMWIKQFFSSTFLKPCGIIMALFTVLQLSGVGAVTFYCITMITEIVGESDAYKATLILDVLRLLSSIVLTLCMRVYSARMLTLCSAFSCSVFLIGLSLSIVFEIWRPYFSLVLLFSYEVSVIMGLTSLPWNFLSEFFSPDHKEIGVGLSTSYYYILFFVVVKSNFKLISLLQIWGTFLLFGCITACGTVVLYKILPDTKNKSLKEIELMFTNHGHRK